MSRRGLKISMISFKSLPSVKYSLTLAFQWHLFLVHFILRLLLGQIAGMIFIFSSQKENGRVPWWSRGQDSAVTAEGSIPGWGTKLPQALRCHQKKKKKRENRFLFVLFFTHFLQSQAFLSHSYFFKKNKRVNALF